MEKTALFQRNLFSGSRSCQSHVALRFVMHLLLLVTLGLASAEVNIDRMMQFVNAQFGSRGGSNYRAWRELLEDVRNMQEEDKLEAVNTFFDRRLRYLDDASIWNRNDYWATPLESLGKGEADCEDYVIAKYFTLIEAGVARNKLRWIYVMATLRVSGGVSRVAHMVLGYYATPDAVPLVLDNLTMRIVSARSRPDLAPVFSFNSDGIWRKGASEATAPVTQMSMWRDLMSRMQEEGYEP